MKKSILLIISLYVTMMLQAQVFKSVNATAGGLSTALTATELNTVTNLTLTGTIDARDFKTMRDSMPVLAELDLIAVTIDAYTGTEGTAITGSVAYPANVLPTGAFSNTVSFNERLKSVILPSSITSIGNWSFGYCNNITSLNVPVGVTSLGNYAFKGCAGLTSLILPEGLISIGFDVFENCTDLTSIIIPAGVTSIGGYTFFGCSGLTSITIPSSVTSIGSAAFLNFNGLITVEASNPNYSSVNGLLFNFTKTKLIQCPVSKTGSYTIPSTVTTIGESAFMGCSGLTSITIPSSVTTIGTQCFNGCSGLSSIFANPILPVDLSSSSGVFGNVDKSTCGLFVPQNSKNAYQESNQWKDFDNIFEKNGFVLSASSVKLAYTDNASDSVIITANTSWTANSDQTWLSVNPQTGTGNETLVFKAEQNNPNEDRLATVTVSAADIPSQTISVTQEAGPVTVNVSAGGLSEALTVNEKNTFTKLRLTGVIDARDFKTMRDNMPLLAVLDLSGVTIAAYNGIEGTGPGSSKYPADAIPKFAFCDSTTSVGKTSLTSFILPSSVKSIGNYSLKNCSGLIGALTLPSSVTTIGDGAFYNCLGISSINIPEGVTSIRFSTFKYCSALTSIIIPKGVTSIEGFVFSYCTKLTSIKIPSLVTLIEQCAFDNCSGLTSIYAYRISPVDLGSNWGVFNNVNKNLCTLYVPSGSKAGYSAANQWNDFTNIVEMQGVFLSATDLIFGADGGSTQLNLVSSTDWTTTSNQVWLTLIPASGSGSESIAFTASANATNTMRTATVTVAAVGFETQTITITQYGIVEVTAGNLKNVLSSELGAITKLKLTGTIDARDFKSMRDSMPLLAEVDLSGVTIVAYSGTEGTSQNITDYLANAIPGYAFYNFSTGMSKRSLISVLLPATVTSVENYAFYGSSGLTSVILPSSLISIKSGAFRSCNSLTSITIPSFVTSIGQDAFYDCLGLTSVIIPKGLATIGGSAFYNCNGLTSIYSHGVTPVDLNSSSDVFFNVNKTTCILHVSYGSSGLYSAANQWKDFLNIVEISGFKLSATIANVGATLGSTTSVNISSDITWTASSDQTWLTVDPTSDTGNKTLTFTAGANLSATVRTATVTVSASEVESQTIVITQKAADKDPYVIDSIDNISVDEGAPDQIIDLKTVFADDDPEDVLIYSVTSNTNDLVVTAIITGSNLTLDFSSVNVGSSEIVITASSNGKEASSKFEVEVKIPTGIDPMMSNQKMIIYPNPTSGKVQVVFDRIPQSGTSLTVKDVNGKTILKQLVQNKEVWIDLSRNSPGVYLIQTNINEIKVQKVILK
ncbi:MAG: leucine-rich repeat protein [Bacteroidia bacterium]|nr:leucine-rich repeat protein [Bacteroidia bacterium]